MLTIPSPIAPRRAWPLLVVLLALSCTQCRKAPPPGPPPPRPLSGKTSLPAHKPAVPIRRLMVVSIDGLRPDLMLRAGTPTIRALMNEGSFTCYANTTEMAVTLPSHVSMMTGVTPPRHGVTWNSEGHMGPQKYPKAPTLLELAKAAGFTTAMVSGKGKFEAFNRPGTLDHVRLPEGEVGWEDDQWVAAEAAAVVDKHKPQVLFVHFPSVDGAGHWTGWGSDEQVRAIEGADAALGQVIAALKRQGVWEQTAVILSADHGGAARGHGPNDPRSRFIPWITRGPGIRRNLDLTLYYDLSVNTEDTFATACWLLGIPYDEAIDGKPIMQIKEQSELLEDLTWTPSTVPATLPVP